MKIDLNRRMRMTSVLAVVASALALGVTSAVAEPVAGPRDVRITITSFSVGEDGDALKDETFLTGCGEFYAEAWLGEVSDQYAVAEVRKTGAMHPLGQSWYQTWCRNESSKMSGPHSSAVLHGLTPGTPVELTTGVAEYDWPGTAGAMSSVRSGLLIVPPAGQAITLSVAHHKTAAAGTLSVVFALQVHTL